MIAIFTKSTDESTDGVLFWLNYLKSDYNRINLDTDRVLDYYLDLESKIISIVFTNGTIFDLSNFSTYWYRRGELQFQNPKVRRNFQESLDICLAHESRILNDHFFRTLESSCIGIGSNLF